MQLSGTSETFKFYLQVLSNLYDIERKLSISGDPSNAKRNVERIKDIFKEQHVFYEDPMGQPFSETRTDLDATITGESSHDLKVVEVIKPIIRYGDEIFSRVVQKGIVIVESDSGEK